MVEARKKKQEADADLAEKQNLAEQAGEKMRGVIAATRAEGTKREADDMDIEDLDADKPGDDERMQKARRLLRQARDEVLAMEGRPASSSLMQLGFQQGESRPAAPGRQSASAVFTPYGPKTAPPSESTAGGAEEAMRIQQAKLEQQKKTDAETEDKSRLEAQFQELTVAANGAEKRREEAAEAEAKATDRTSEDVGSEKRTEAKQELREANEAEKAAKEQLDAFVAHHGGLCPRSGQPVFNNP